MSASKRAIISTLATRHNVDVVCLEETHVDTDKSSLFTLAGFDLISYRLHAKHGRATYVKSSLADASAELSTDHCDVIKVGSYSIANVYKPPSESWDTSVPLPALSHRAIYVGDFSSHHPDWGYDSEDPECARLMEWASLGDFALIHDPKQQGTFRSTRWQRDFSPELCWVSTTNCSRLPAS